MSPRTIRIRRLLELLCENTEPMLPIGPDLGFARSLENCGFATEYNQKWRVTDVGRKWLGEWKKRKAVGK